MRHAPPLRQVLYVTGVAVVVALAGTAGRIITSEIASLLRQPPPDISQRLTAVASGLNKSLPMMVDSETEMFSVMGLGDTISYNVRLVNVEVGAEDWSRAQAWLDDALKSEIPRHTRRVCSQPNAGEALAMGATPRYVYFDNQDTYLTEYTIAEADCSGVLR